jgi:hypothetical protein
MAKRPAKRSARTARREQERAQSRLQSDRERLFQLQAGGRPEQPIEVRSAAVIEAQASSVPCPRCGGSHELIEHAAVTHAGVRLRQAKLRCRQCGSERSLWFRIVGTTLN